MIRNYFKIAWRNLIRNKSFSFINIVGLSLGLASSIFIFIWVKDERAIDTFHENGEQLYVVTSREYTGNEIFDSYDTPGLLAEELKDKIPEIEYGCNIGWNSYHTFSANQKTLKLKGNYAGADFFSMFSYSLLIGSKETILKSPESIAISKKMAVSLFGSIENAIDKTIKFENYIDLHITGVFDDLKNNVSEKFDYIINWNLFIKRHSWVNNWGNSGPTSYIQLKEGVTSEIVSPKIKSFISNYDKNYSDDDKLELGLQRFNEAYLYSKFENGIPSKGRIEYVNLFSIIAIFILLIACINFVNLSTALSIKKAKEIGVRKVIGAKQPELIKQFLAETLIFTTIAIFISLLLVALLLPAFNDLTSKQISSPFINGTFWLNILGLTIITALIAGSYPAFLLSSFKPISVLKTNIVLNPKSGFLRKGLVVFQFVLSILFIVGVIVISKQINFIQTKNIGYDKENLVYIPTTGNIEAKFDVFKNKGLEISGVNNISIMSYRPVGLDNTTSSVDWLKKAPNTKISFTPLAVGYDFIKTIQADLLHGRDFSLNFSDTDNYIINETALKKIGYKNPIGMPLTFWGKKGTIVGVVKDFHFNSLHVPIAPLVIRMSHNNEGYAIVRIQSDNIQIALEGLKKLYEQLNPNFPFAHQFANEEYDLLYKSEQVVHTLSNYFAFLAIFISCLGLLGAVLFTAEQRKREIGIRKVLGANIAILIKLITKDFLIMVSIAFVITIPIAWFIMQNWLENFEYKVTVNWPIVFAIAGACVFITALLTMSFQAIKTAVANPVKSLRTE